MKSYIPQIRILENSIENIVWFIGIIILGLILKSLIGRFLSWFTYNLFKEGEKRETAKKFMELIQKPLNLIILLLFIFVAFQHLVFPMHIFHNNERGELVELVLHRVFYTFIAISMTWGVMRIVDFIGYKLLLKTALTETESDDQLVQFFAESTKVFVIIISALFILGSIYNFNVTSIVAGLGIGGLAFALAAKESLENLLGSFTILLDRPFVKGDLVTVENITGHVETVGFRSTRIRTLEKSYLTVPNKIMVNAKLDNLTERTLRRVDFTIGLTYNSTKEQILNIVTEINTLLDSIEIIDENPTVKFTDFGDSSLNIRVLFFLKSMDFDVFTALKQDVNLGIMDIVKKHGSDFAFPSRTVYLQQNN